MTREMQELYYDAARPKLDVLYYDNGKLTYIGDIVESVSLSGDTAKSCRTASVSFKNTSNGRSRLINIQNGREMRFLLNGKELMRGNIFSTEQNESGNETVTVYDPNIYLSKNEDVIKMNNVTASDVIRKLAAAAGIKLGRIDNTGYRIPKLYIAGKTYYDMIVIALTETQKATGQRYMLRNREGALELIKVQGATTWLRIEAGRNLITASYRESIEDVKTKVKMTSGDEFKPSQTAVAGGTNQYGTMQHYEHNSDAEAAKKLQSMARSLLNELSKPKREMSVETLGLPDVVAGTALVVEDALSGLKGGYFVTADSHEFDAAGVHTMSLTLSKTLDLPFEEYDPPEENKPAPSGGSGSSGGSGGSGRGGSASAPASSKAQEVVRIANSYKGKLRYVFGGKNLASGGADCSGFTYQIYKQVGVDIGHGTSNQVTKGTRISTGEAKPGDLVFFQGTYRSGVSHVGIVTRPGYCVSLASSGCKEHSYTSGYWGNHFMQIRRVL